MALDQVEVGVYKPGPGLKRVWFEESVEEPESTGGEDASQLGQITRFVFDAVKTSHVECEVERRGDALHLSGIVGEDVCVYACLLKFSFGEVDGF